MAPPSVSWAEVQVSFEMFGLLACPGISFCVLGLNVRSGGAVPAGRVCALNSGAASLPTFTPGACCGGLLAGELR